MKKNEDDSSDKSDNRMEQPDFKFEDLLLQRDRIIEYYLENHFATNLLPANYEKL